MALTLCRSRCRCSDGTHCDVSSAAANQEWDFTRFDVRFWQKLDRTILEMQKLVRTARLRLTYPMLPVEKPLAVMIVG